MITLFNIDAGGITYSLIQGLISGIDSYDQTYDDLTYCVMWLSAVRDFLDQIRLCILFMQGM